MKRLILIFGVCTFAWLGLGGCGDDDCPTCPEPADGFNGRAYVTQRAGPVALYVIDIGADSVIDSLVFPSATGVNARVSADGRYLFTSVTDHIFRVFDTRDFSLVATTATFGEFELVHHDSMVLGFRYDSLTLYSYPDFDTVMQAVIPHRGAPDSYLPDQRCAYRLRGADTLLAISEDSLKVVDEWVIREGDAPTYYLSAVAIHPNVRTAYFIAYGPGTAAFLVYDLVLNRVVSSFPLNGPFGYLKVHPNGKEVWVTDPWITNGTYISSAILVFDASTGGLRNSISLVGYFPENPLVPLTARNLEFTPDGSNVFVSTGDGRAQGGTILRINTITNKIERVYFPDFRLYPYEIAIGKKP